MRMTEFFSYVNDEMSINYIPYHLDITTIKNNKEVKALKKAIKKRKKDILKSSIEDIDIFGED